MAGVMQPGFVYGTWIALYTETTSNGDRLGLLLIMTKLNGVNTKPRPPNFFCREPPVRHMTFIFSSHSCRQIPYGTISSVCFGPAVIH